MYFIASAAPGVNATSPGVILGSRLVVRWAMSLASRPLVLVGAIIATGFCLFLALQAAALLLPFVLSGPYRWVWAPLSIVLIVLSGYLRVRKRRKAELPQR